MHERGRVILLGGWLLLSPPWAKDVEPNAAAPISEWTQVGAFDTAKECEKAKTDRTTRWDERLEKTQGKTPPVILKLSAEDYMMRCVPAESVYPPQQPAAK